MNYVLLRLAQWRRTLFKITNTQIQDTPIRQTLPLPLLYRQKFCNAYKMHLKRTSKVIFGVYPYIDKGTFIYFSGQWTQSCGRWTHSLRGQQWRRTLPVSRGMGGGYTHYEDSSGDGHFPLVGGGVIQSTVH